MKTMYVTQRETEPIERNERDLRGLLTSIAVCELVGLVSGVVTRDDVETWYERIEKPRFTPPNERFYQVWTVLFFLMGVSVHRVRREASSTPRGRRALGLFGTQLLLNVAWTLTFFGQRSPLGGFIVIPALWAAVAATILAFWHIDRRAALLLIPYLAWCTFAIVLTGSIWRLNRTAERNAN